MNESIELTAHCTVCTLPIPPERVKKKSVTCSKEHQIMRKKWLRTFRDSHICRYCNKPSNMEERTQFARWRNFQPTAGAAAVMGILAGRIEDVLKLAGQEIPSKDKRSLAKAFAYVRDQAEIDQPAELPAEVDEADDEEEMEEAHA